MTLLTTLMGECRLEALKRLQCVEGMVPLWESNLADRLSDLRCLLLPSCGLTALPPGKQILPFTWRCPHSTKALIGFLSASEPLTALAFLAADIQGSACVPSPSMKIWTSVNLLRTSRLGFFKIYNQVCKTVQLLNCSSWQGDGLEGAAHFQQ